MTNPGRSAERASRTRRARWTLPFEVRPFALETADSYFRRLTRANYCSSMWLKHRAKLVVEAWPEHAENARIVAVELLGGLRLGTFDDPLHRPRNECTLADCECARPLSGDRSLCVECARGQQVALVATLEPFVCTRHQRWVGPAADSTRQPSVRGLRRFERAAHTHRRLLRTGRLDPLRFRAIWGLLDNAYRDNRITLAEEIVTSDWRYDPEIHARAITYPAAVDLYERLEAPEVLGQILHPGNDLAQVESHLTALLAGATLAGSDDKLVRDLRYHLRGDFYRVALATTPGWHQGRATSYPPPKVAPHDRDLSAIDYRPWPRKRRGTPPGYPGFDTGNSPLHILDEAGSRFRHEFWFDERGRLFGEQRGGHRRPCTWICRAGHVSEALLGTRNNSNRRGCSACAGKIAVPGVTDIATTHPDAFEYWDHSANVDLPYWEQTAGRDRVAQWVCARGHAFPLPINLFLADPHCKACDVPNQRKVDLEVEFTEFASWWDTVRNKGHDPHSLAMYSEVVYWLCPDEGHPFDSTIHNLQRNGGRCPVCTHRRLVPGVNDLQTLFPDQAEEFSLALNGGTTPDQVWPASPFQYLWVCRKKGHAYKRSPRERTALGIGCTQCTGRRSTPGETDFGTLKPEEAARWHWTANGVLTPADVHPGSAKQAYFTCLCDIPYRCEIRIMRPDRYCRSCTDGLRAWSSEHADGRV